jgi:hypothetical protein
MITLGFVHFGLIPLIFFILFLGIGNLFCVILKCCYGIKPKDIEIKWSIFGVFAFIIVGFLTGG